MQAAKEASTTQDALTAAPKLMTTTSTSSASGRFAKHAYKLLFKIDDVCIH
jgi:hypothetical protein